jgi:hypothetical protein
VDCGWTMRLVGEHFYLEGRRQRHF